MHRCGYLVALVFLAGCTRVNVADEQDALLTVDREWSQTVKEPEKFLSYFADDATIYAPGAPMVTGRRWRSCGTT